MMQGIHFLHWHGHIGALTCEQVTVVLLSQALCAHICHKRALLLSMVS